ncbi:MAG TPA: SGNH/GDSL hydrolase family protein [Candidatus Stackebrandtia excrementipullorum]|nr:SGNH/GDSL hydrolase family protein [Candidatus Stackebrandtia excrementipullorum]
MWYPRRLGVLVTVVALALAGVSSAAVAREPGLDYVALGDSYTAGSGAGDYDTTNCRRSNNSYPELVASYHEWDLTSVACAGAHIHDVWDNQLDVLADDTDRVTISIGGNDAGWVDVISACMVIEDDECEGHVNRAWDNIRENLYYDLRALYAEIKLRAPDAAIAVVGYPRLFGETECTDAPGLSVTEQQWINRAADLLNRTTMRAAFAEGLWFIDVRSQFTQHGVCDEVPWINGPRTAAGDSFHPTAAGYQGYADAVDWLWGA